MQQGRAKIVSLISIFVVSSSLIAVALVLLLTDGSGSRNQFLESFMAILIIILVYAVVDMCRRPSTSGPSSNSSFSSHESNRGSITNMDMPLVYAESPPAYEDVVRTSFHETSFSEVAGSANDGTTGATALSTSRIPKNSNDTVSAVNNVPILEPSSNRDTAEGSEITHDFEEIYIPERFSPFFNDESPVQNLYTPHRELQLAVDYLPTYEQALNIVQSEPRDPRASNARAQNNDLILFM